MLFASLVLHAQDTLFMKSYEKNDQLKQFMLRDSGTVILTSEKFDQHLMDLINAYRNKNNLPNLNRSIRLDTLAVKEMHQCQKLETIIHYTHIKEMAPYKDLLGAENLAKRESLSTSYDLLSLSFVSADVTLSNWIKSPGHNRNLLIDQKNADVATVLSSVVLKFSNKDKKFFCSMIAYYVFEIDHHESVRETLKTRTWVPTKKPVIKH